MLKSKTLGLTGGILTGVIVFIVTLISSVTGFTPEILTLFALAIPGYTATITGSIIGLVYGFLEGFIILYLFSWTHNMVSKTF